MRYFLLLLTFLLFNCTQNDKTKNKDNGDNVTVLTSLEIQDILTNWKKDSLGCLGLRRNPEKLNLLTKQMGLIGKDSLTIIGLFGQPNEKYGQGNERHFVYFTECSDGKTSYSNYYCHFKQDTVDSFSWATF
jgi:hypothetical protein